LRWTLVVLGAALVGILFWDRIGWLVAEPAAPPPSVEARSRPAITPPLFNTLVYPVDRRGHVMIDAVVNGAPVRMLVDTGASLVTLTPDDARAAGFTAADLQFNRAVHTANGLARMAPVTLREVRIGQLTIDDVPAAVMEKLNVSLLGASFLGRLQSYEMRDGKLTLNW
jgi:aspartyl protease family protein